jgi:hypothetical protein
VRYLNQEPLTVPCRQKYPGDLHVRDQQSQGISAEARKHPAVIIEKSVFLYVVQGAISPDGTTFVEIAHLADDGGNST